MLFDTHTHINAEEYNDDFQEMLNRAEDAGVTEMIVVGFDTPTIDRAMEIVEKHDAFYAAVGWHPVDAIDMTDENLERLRTLAAHPKVVALGEMGLDYHWDKSPKEIQKKVFRHQIRLAREVNLPIIIHNREATEDIIQILQEEHAKEVGGVMHCFSDDWEAAKACLEMNFHIGIGGPVTFKNAALPKEVAANVPIERLLIETDCPYLSPHPFRGKRNEPARVKLIAEKIAELKEISYEELAQQTTRNARRLFGLSEQ